MRAIRTLFPLLARDDRSAVQPKAAIVASLVILATAATGLYLTSLGEAAYEQRARRVLFALHGDTLAAHAAEFGEPGPSVH
jgi:hypothetical protein